MIHALHLLWIVPVAAFIGFMVGALMAKQKDGDEQ